MLPLSKDSYYRHPETGEALDACGKPIKGFIAVITHSCPACGLAMWPNGDKTKGNIPDEHLFSRKVIIIPKDSGLKICPCCDKILKPGETHEDCRGALMEGCNGDVWHEHDVEQCFKNYLQI